MKKVLFFGACVVGGIVAAKVVRKIVNKTTENLEVKESEKFEKNVDRAVTVGCAAVVLKCAYDIITTLDERSRVTYLISLMNSALIGNIDAEIARQVVAKHYPTYSKKAKEALEPFINATFPELLG